MNFVPQPSDKTKVKGITHLYLSFFGVFKARKRIPFYNVIMLPTFNDPIKDLSPAQEMMHISLDIFSYFSAFPRKEI